VPVKTAVGQSGVLHEISHADAVDAGLAKPRSRYLHDSIVALVLVRF